MQTEIEAKFPEIDGDDLRRRLGANGATLVHEDRLMRRRNYDYADSRLEKIGGWVRVRDEGEGVATISYKQLQDRTLHGTKEVSVRIGDFDDMCRLLEAIGLINKSYQETRRERWLLDGVEVTIDTWPWIPSFVELEGESEGQLRRVAALLGLDWSRAMHGSVETVYQMRYDVTEEEVDSWPEITFVPVPDWLEKKKK